MSSSSVHTSSAPATSFPWRRAAVIVVASLVVLVAAAAILLLTIDLGRFKGPLTDAASETLGRELRIDGALSVRIGRNIEISATDVVIENADWAGDAPLLTIDTLTAELVAASAVTGALEFKRVELAGVRALLVENDAGEVNWQLGGTTEEATDDPEASPEDSFAFEHVTITDFVASISSPDLTDSLTVRIAELEHTIADGRLVDRIDGTVDNVPLVVEGHIGSRSSILNGGPATFDYDGQLGEIVFAAQGSFDNVHAPREPRVEFSLKGPDAQYLFRTLNLPDATTGALDVGGRLGRVAGRIEFAVHGQVGEFNFDADGWASELSMLAEGEVTVAVSGPDLDRVANVLGVDQLPRAAFRFNGALRKSGTELDIDSLTLAVSGSEIALHGRLPRFPELADAELAFNATGEDLAQFADLPASPFGVSGEAAFIDGRIRLAETVVRIGEATATLAGDIEPAGRDTGLNLSVASSVPDLEAFLSSLGVNGAPSVEADIVARVEHGGGETRITEVDGHVGDVEIAGSLALATKQEQVTAAFNAALYTPRLDTVVPKTPTFAVAPVSGELQTSGTYTGARLELAGFTAKVGDATFAVQGSIDDVREISGVALSLKADIPDLAALGSSEKYAIPALPLRLEGDVSEASGAWSVNDLLASVGNSRLQANLRYARGDVPDIEFEALAGRIDMRDILPKPVSRAENSEQAGDRVIPAIEFPVERMSRFNVAVNVRVDELLTHSLDLRDIVVDGYIRDGALHFETLDIRGPRGHVVGGLDYRRRGETLALSGSFSGDNVILAAPGEPEEVARARPTYELESEFSGQGTGLREILASLEGRTLMHGGRGINPDSGGVLTAMFFGDFATQLLDTLNPFTGTKKTIPVRCAVLMLSFEDGIVSGDPALVVQTDQLNIFGRGKVNLGTEAVEISINTAVRKGLGISLSDIVAPYTIVRGTLASPTLTVSEKDVLFQGGAAVATGGLTIIAKGLKNRFLADKKPCETALETYRKAAAPLQ